MKRYFYDEYVFLAFTLVLASISLVDVNSAFMIGTVAIPGSLWFFIVLLMNKSRRSHFSRGLLCLGCALLLASGPAGCTYNEYKVEGTFVPVIESLTQYKSAHGVYPKTLEKLSMNSIPMCPDPIKNVHYFVREAGKEYELTCKTIVFNKHTYKSKTETWLNWD